MNNKMQINGWRISNGAKSRVSYEIDSAFIGGLLGLNNLKTNRASDIQKKLRALSADCGYSSCMVDPLSQLLLYAEDRIVNGQFVDETTRKITGRDRELPKRLEEIIDLSPDLPEFCRVSPSWVKDTDYSHTVSALDYAFTIANQVNLSPQQQKILISALIFHDVAYPATDSYQDFTSPANREAHMKNASQLFRHYAGLINKDCQNQNSQSFYSSDEIEETCNIIGQHDNPGMGKDFDYSKISDPRLLFVVREADRLWMLDQAGFALDLLREIVEKDRYDPRERLKYVIRDHIKEAGVYEKFADQCLPLGTRPSIYRDSASLSLALENIKDITRKYALQPVPISQI